MGAGAAMGAVGAGRNGCRRWGRHCHWTRRATCCSTCPHLAMLVPRSPRRCPHWTRSPQWFCAWRLCRNCRSSRAIRIAHMFWSGILVRIDRSSRPVLARSCCWHCVLLETPNTKTWAPIGRVHGSIARQWKRTTRSSTGHWCCTWVDPCPVPSPDPPHPNEGPILVRCVRVSSNRCRPSSSRSTC